MALIKTSFIASLTQGQLGRDINEFSFLTTHELHIENQKEWEFKCVDISWMKTFEVPIQRKIINYNALSLSYDLMFTHAEEKML